MSYREEDVWFFATLVRWLPLATPRRATSRLTYELERLRDYRPALLGFPELQIDGLDFWYATLRGIGATDEVFLRQMLRRCGSPGLVWGGWLALIAPRPEYRDALLASRRPAHEGNDWAVHCALADLDGQEWPRSCAALRGLVSSARELLADVRVERMPLRPEFTPAEYERLKRERDRVREAYAQGGLAASRSVIDESELLRSLLKSYPVWYRETGRPLLAEDPASESE